MSAWAVAEVPTALKMNQKTVLVSATAPVSPQDGQLWYDTVNECMVQYNAVLADWFPTGGIH